MGLCIHYLGNIKQTGLLKDMIPEEEEIVSIYQWKYTIYPESYNLFGKDRFVPDWWFLVHVLPGSK